MDALFTSSIFETQIGKPPKVSQPNECSSRSQQELHLVRPLASVQHLNFLHQAVFLTGRLVAGPFEMFPWHVEQQWQKLWMTPPHPCFQGSDCQLCISQAFSWCLCVDNSFIKTWKIIKNSFWFYWQDFVCKEAEKLWKTFCLGSNRNTAETYPSIANSSPLQSFFQPHSKLIYIPFSWILSKTSTQTAEYDHSRKNSKFLFFLIILGSLFTPCCFTWTSCWLSNAMWYCHFRAVFFHWHKPLIHSD